MAIDCLIKDYENFDYSKIKKEYPIGKINFFMNNTFSDMTAGYYEDSFERGLIIFPCFENCVNYLNSIGVIDELGFDYSSINRVSITNYNNEQRNAEITELESHGEYVDYEALDIKYSKTTTYSGDYEELFENINFTSGSFWRFDGGADLDYDYEVDIFFEENSKDALRCEMNPVYTYLKQGYTPKGF